MATVTSRSRCSDIAGQSDDAAETSLHRGQRAFFRIFRTHIFSELPNDRPTSFPATRSRAWLFCWWPCEIDNESIAIKFRHLSN